MDLTIRNCLSYRKYNPTTWTTWNYSRSNPIDLFKNGGAWSTQGFLPLLCTHADQLRGHALGRSSGQTASWKQAVVIDAGNLGVNCHTFRSCRTTHLPPLTTETQQ